VSWNHNRHEGLEINGLVICICLVDILSFLSIIYDNNSVEKKKSYWNASQKIEDNEPRFCQNQTFSSPLILGNYPMAPWAFVLEKPRSLFFDANCSSKSLNVSCACCSVDTPIITPSILLRPPK